MIDKQLSQIDLFDLQSLVKFSRSEGRRLDFKVLFPGTSNRAVRDFLADVTAFANTDGGDIVVGIRDDGNGHAAELVGIPNNTIDSDLLRIEHQLRECVDPRLPAFRAHCVEIEQGKVALVLRIGPSDVGPHRVTHGGTSRFYARNSRGIFEMSTTELRRAFTASDEMPKKIRDLHRQAVAATNGKDMPCRLADAPFAVLTVAPMSIFRETRDIRVRREEAVLPPLLETSGMSMVTGLNGLFVYSQPNFDSGNVSSWSINHRRGYLDFAWTIGGTRKGQKLVWRKQVDGHLAGSASASVARLRSYGLEGPWVAMATLGGLREHQLVTGDSYLTSAAWQDTAYLGEVVDDVLTPQALQPILDGFWRLFGVDEGPPIGT